MKTTYVALVSLVLGLILGAGFIARINTAEKEPISLVHNVDYFISDESFSEVHNAKAVLGGLSRRFVTELRSSAWLKTQQNSHMSSSAAFIPALEQGIEEFKGTEYEMGLIADLLRALKAEGLHERWLETYLKALYTHPTDELVATFSSDAMQMSLVMGRTEEVGDALHHVCNIPVAFPSRARLRAVVAKLFPPAEPKQLSYHQSIGGDADHVPSTEEKQMRNSQIWVY